MALGGQPIDAQIDTLDDLRKLPETKIFSSLGARGTQSNMNNIADLIPRITYFNFRNKTQVIEVLNSMEEDQSIFVGSAL